MGTRFQKFNTPSAQYFHENLYKTSKAHKFLLEVTELQLKQKYSVNIYEAEAFNSDIFKIENEEFCYGLMGIAASWLPAIIFWFYTRLWNLRSWILRYWNLRSRNLKFRFWILETEIVKSEISKSETLESEILKS